MIHEVFKLEDLIRLSCDIRPLRDGRRIRRYDGVGHAASCSNGTSKVSDLSSLIMTIVTKCGPKENFDQMWPEKIAPHGRTCHAADSDQMWSKYCPSPEDFITQRTLTKCGPKNCPSSKDFVTQWTPTKCGPNIVPHWRTLSHSGL